MSHTSTVSEAGGYNRLSSTVAQMLGNKKRSPANFRRAQPGNSYRYSNFGSGLVGSIVETVSGQSVARFVQERLFDPLQMDASLVASWLKEPEHISTLHRNGKLYKAGSRYLREQQHLLGASVTGESPYGLCMDRNTRVLPGKVIYGHQGMTGGANNNSYFEPDSGFVFTLTTNGASQVRDHGTVLLAQHLLRYTYPLFSGTAE